MPNHLIEQMSHLPLFDSHLNKEAKFIKSKAYSIKVKEEFLVLREWRIRTLIAILHNE
jgi:hypothetical protein